MDAKATRTRSEHGAIAIMVGLMATVLFGVSALAVDMGNAWARKREVQKQVDVSALSVGWLLPMRPANKLSIANKVAEYFNESANDVVGQQSVTGTQLINGVGADGEVTFEHEDASPCADECPQMRVLAPAARVDVGLGAVFGIDFINVQATSAVRIASELPPKDKTIPFWLPTGCGFGPTEADTTQGNGNQVTSPTALPTSTPTATAAPAPYVPTPVGSHTLTGAAVTQVGYLGSTSVSGYWINGVASQFKKVTLRAFPPTGTAFVDFAAQTSGNGAVPTFSISQEISATTGNWRVYALAEKQNDNQREYSSNYLTIQVNPPATSPSPTPTPTPTDEPTSGVVVGCVGQDRGNFGQLDSPRIEGGAKQTRLAKNIALGIDHTLVPYVFPPGLSERKDCGAPDGSLLLGAHLDDHSADGNNCITGDTGNDGPKIMDGLIQGLSGGIPGRLDVANGSTTCPTRSDAVVSGKLINNDVLSCYLRNGATLTDISQPGTLGANLLDPAVVNSPRFVWLPVVYATDRAQKNFQPIRHFVPGFITDETQTTAATGSNGLDINGNSVSVLHIFTFNRTALPPIDSSDTVDFDPEIGGAIVRLVG